MAPTSLRKRQKSERTKRETSRMGLPRFQLDISTLDVLNAAPSLYSFPHALLGSTRLFSETAKGRGVKLGHFG